MSTLRISGLLLALALAVSAFAAYPTLSGPSGQAVIPTAMTAGPGFTIAADYHNLDEGSVIPIRVLFGFGDTIEVGVLYATLDDVAPFGLDFDNPWGVNAKWKFAQFLGGDAAIGGQYITAPFTIEGIDFDGTVSQAYFAWTREFGLSETQNLGFTWGVNWTQIDPDIIDSVDDTRFFAGLDLALSDRISVLADYQTRSDELLDERALSAVTARIRLTNAVVLQFGSTNAFGPIATEDHNFFAGLGFQFGGAQDEVE
ncbi:MAG: hypothetical protein ACYDCO_22365 [Armatimonadota bacterium]